ncbi:hypothetical protein [Sphingobacterium sp. JUb78]|nr:hypothetical protein [Sphingobacterium sp. JUb78]MCW2261543.1 tetratricopeptide (TPR) repeat protein [Sphingobacterium kitahiroshimense]TCR03649.1 tetratricopeptide repeat protein [Sphingobacterium sp. JUb20]
MRIDAIYFMNKYVLQALDSYPYYLENTLESLSYALSYDDSNTMALCLMGRLHAEQLFDFEQAKKYFQEALVHNLYALEIYQPYIQTLIDTNAYEEAEKTIEFALTIPGVSSSLFLLKRVLILEKLKKFKKALKVLNLVRLENLDSEMLSTIKDVEDRIKGKRKIGRKSKK